MMGFAIGCLCVGACALCIGQREDPPWSPGAVEVAIYSGLQRGILDSRRLTTYVLSLVYPGVSRGPIVDRITTRVSRVLESTL